MESSSADSGGQSPPQPGTDGRFKLTPSGAKLIVVTVAAACAGMVATLTQAVAPGDMPVLVVPSGAYAAQLRADEAQAVEEVTGPEVERLRELLDRQGRAEAGLGETPEITEERARALRRLLTMVDRQHGGNGHIEGALRAQAALRLGPALAGELSSEEERAVLGSFPRMLERYGAARDGVTVAPRLVIHAMYKARWNFQVGREPTAGLSDAELRAYWGWAATTDVELPDELRRMAVRGYAEVGGHAAREVVAIQTYRDGATAAAARLFEELYADTGQLRYRNHALGALYVSAR